jgi:hypothetical protein
VVALSTSPDPRLPWRDAGRLIRTALSRLLFVVGWLVAKTLRMVATAIAATLLVVGWCAAKAWTVLWWCGRAVRLGWQEGRKPAGAKAG